MLNLHNLVKFRLEFLAVEGYSNITPATTANIVSHVVESLRKGFNSIPGFGEDFQLGRLLFLVILFELLLIVCNNLLDSGNDGLFEFAKLFVNNSTELTIKIVEILF